MCIYICNNKSSGSLHQDLPVEHLHQAHLLRPQRGRALVRQAQHGDLADDAPRGELRHLHVQALLEHEDVQQALKKGNFRAIVEIKAKIYIY